MDEAIGKLAGPAIVGEQTVAAGKKSSLAASEEQSSDPGHACGVTERHKRAARRPGPIKTNQPSLFDGGISGLLFPPTSCTLLL
jgi:hypothetical protein